MSTEQRKMEHIEICLTESVQYKNKTTGLEEVELIYQTLPEINENEVNLSIEFLGKKLKAPLMVTAITGGCKKAEKINKDIASACEETGIAFGLGSQRAMIENKELSYSYKVREVAPNTLIIGNIGVLQAKKFSKEQIENTLNEVDCDALAIHLNVAQEIMQGEEKIELKGALEEIKKISKELKKRVIVKEVGHGINYETAKKLNETNIQAIDVAGAGGTSWIGIDSIRGKTKLGKTYWDFGIPTALSILEVKKATRKTIIASGGIRTGLDVVKTIVLGATLAGMSLPVLKAQAKNGKKGVKELLQKTIEEIKTGMMLTGAKNVKELQEKEFILNGKTLEWAKQRKLI